ncbi:bifunctional glutamate N-acetyltransferase/amino-acid acetyltransferase ArgJ [Methyloligella sp. 2.7D]|uniref:bifunctional glutamate N-acetyltransferase/amino-acid acetyltransferase ArgJ n=1 Tax=unclassified Methyloligella TaxID=2625955 RepID=UPI00157CF0F2|nr:bifunctional glutamate N-acetyltransferase/amino-acid acetyltransferase ArgJ [Methyloligella sp. GL2]QKP76595.1 bifunctional glutamate N-acetyltransferase/amino-acid acetyltransferase ArgJ [Methyloligella sp. GL2]
MLKRSPLAPDVLPALPPIDGVRLAACEAGIRYKNRTDLMLAVFDPGTTVAGVLTRSKCTAAPIDWARAHLDHGMARALVVNSGIANAFTGRQGWQAVEETAEAAAQALGCLAADVYLGSTGVIGEQLDAAKIASQLPGLAEAASPDGYAAAAQAIMTTDTFPKLATVKTEIGGVEVTLNGIAKGSGMIAPDMATMLTYLFTDAAIEPAVLRSFLPEIMDRSFNAITVDSDTSTSDMALLFATGASTKRGAPRIGEADDPRLAAFRDALLSLSIDLAQQVVRDGEGATKFVEIAVLGAEDDRAARVIGKAIANSPLVKTAIAGEDPNWGRIVAAVGKAGEKADRDRLSIRFGDISVAKDGAIDPDYREEQGAAFMKNPELRIAVDVGVGSGEARVWTCDLTHGYIDINADYRS